MLTLQRQQQHLQKVSRTFALTIPLMQGELADVIANAYLICRIADTIEDDPRLPAPVKVHWLCRFARELDAGFADDEQLLILQDEATRQLKDSAVPAEYELCTELCAVLQRTRSFRPEVRQVIGHGAAVLSRGMAQAMDLGASSPQDLSAVDAYCYSVAGVVGELLAQLFALYDERADRQQLLDLSVSFGEGLQLTNILKDRATDEQRAVAFLPVTEHGLSGKDLILSYCALAQGHLQQAADFTCLLSPQLYGVRYFCLLNIAMAVLTLRKIEANPLGTQQELKISRRAVRLQLLLSGLCARFNCTLRWYLRLLRRGSAIRLRDPVALRARVSRWEQS